MTKTINKEDLITICGEDKKTVGELFSTYYDAEISKGVEHAEAHNIADDKLALAIKNQNTSCLDCNEKIDHKA